MKCFVLPDSVFDFDSAVVAVVHHCFVVKLLDLLVFVGNFFEVCHRVGPEQSMTVLRPFEVLPLHFLTLSTGSLHVLFPVYVSYIDRYDLLVEF